MSFAKLRDLRRSVAFRLSLAYTALFTLAFLIAYVAIFLMMRTSIRNRLDEELVEELHEIEAIIGERDLAEAEEDLKREAEFDGVEEFFIRIYDDSGEQVFASNLFFWRGIEAIQPPASHLTEPVLQTTTLRNGEREVRVVEGPIGNGHLTVQLGLTTEDGRRLLANMREVITLTMLFVIIAGAVVSWWIARRSLRGIEMATRTAEEISRGNLDRRVPLTGRGDEIDQLATSFNAMVERMQLVLSSMREITDNIAHDLRSPITRMRGRAELALSRSDARDSDADALAADILEDCDRLLTMINTTLDISELETGVAKMGDESIDLGELILDTGELFGPVAEESGIGLDTRSEAGVRVRGDLPALQRALANLVDNALKYTSGGGQVSIALRNGDGTAEIHVVDTGRGVPESERERIFDRFYRGDESRSERGNGLGLSLARALIEAHGGEIRVQNSPKGGSDFVIRLPVDPQPGPGAST